MSAKSRFFPQRDVQAAKVANGFSCRKSAARWHILPVFIFV
jgi:hypothetical protein